MPNWCNNTMILKHSDPAMMDKALTAWNQGRFLSTMVPEPDYEGYKDCEIKSREGETSMPDWWNWRVANWGTKWDVGYNADEDNQATLSDGEIRVGFTSAWSPPIQAYDSLIEHGFSILAYYFEPGMDFCGRYEDGVDECYTASEDEIPEDIDAEMGVSETMEMYKE